MNILVCGDSHTWVFRYANKKQSIYNFDMCTSPGSSAQGALNNHSKTNAYKIFMNRIKNTKKVDKILIMLGEVDCGFLIYVRSKRYNISINEQIDSCVNNLFGMVKSILGTYREYKNTDIIIAGSVLPSIVDNTDKRFLHGSRKEVDVSQLERTKKTLEYNNKLKKKCIENGYHYIDITNDVIGKDGLISREYVNRNPYDHHLDNEKTYKLWIKQLDKILK